MADIVLRISGPGLVAADALSLVERARIIKFSRAGDREFLSRQPSEVPGFNLQIAESETEPASAIAEARAFVEAKLTDLLALANRGADGELDFGVYVDARGSGMKSTRLDPGFLELLARARLTLCVTSYIVCDDDDDDETTEGDAALLPEPSG